MTSLAASDMRAFPFAITETYSRVTSDPLRLTLSNPFPADIRKYAGVNNSYGQSSSEPKTQYLQSWSLTVEREFRGTVLEVAYAGSKGTHLQRRYDINQPGRSGATQNIRPYPLFNSIQIINDGSNSIFNSGHAILRRRFGKQLFLRASYTYAKSIDESSNTGGTLPYNFPTAQDSSNLRSERRRYLRRRHQPGQEQPQSADGTSSGVLMPLAMHDRGFSRPALGCRWMPRGLPL